MGQAGQRYRQPCAREDDYQERIEAGTTGEHESELLALDRRLGQILGHTLMLQTAQDMLPG
jgi:hypothetical protein